MIKSYKIRLIPTKEQEVLLRLHVDAMRFVWNWGLSTNIHRFENGEKYQGKAGNGVLLTQLKKTDESFNWLNDVSSHTTNQALRDLDDAYIRFFKKQKSEPKFTKNKTAKLLRQNKPFTPYEKNGHPKFKSRHTAESKFYVRAENLYILSDTVNLEKIGKVKYQTNKKVRDILPIVTRKSDNTTKFINPRVKFINNKWILSFGIEWNEDEDSTKIELSNINIGIDLGIKTLATCSNGLNINNINKTKRVKRLEKRLKQQQRALSRKIEAEKKRAEELDKQEEQKTKPKSSKQVKQVKTQRYKKNRAKVTALHKRLANIRLDHVHKATSKIIELLPKTIVIEDLNVSGMMKNKHLSKAIQGCLWGEFVRQIEYKAEWKGIKVIKADRFYASSKLCSNCAWKKKDLKLKERVYICSECGLKIDRDFNATLNLEKLAV